MFSLLWQISVKLLKTGYTFNRWLVLFLCQTQSNTNGSESMRLNKTETELVRRATERGFVGVHAGLHRGRGGTGKLRAFGTRERNAARSLVKKGILVMVSNIRSNDHTAPGYMAPSSDMRFELTTPQPIEVCSVGLTVSDWSECSCSNCK